LMFDLAPPAKSALARVSAGFGGPTPRLARGLAVRDTLAASGARAGSAAPLVNAAVTVSEAASGMASRGVAADGSDPR